MPRVLVAGCGYLGQAVADLWQARGWAVEGWTHSVQSAGAQTGKPYPVIAVDLGDREKVNARPENFDVVVHCASTRGGDAALYRRTYLEGVRNLLDRFVGATLLFTSSTSVYAQTGGEWVTEDSPAEPGHERGRILRDAERLVLGSGGVVARLAGIYGPGRSALLRKFLANQTTVAGDRFVNQIHRDDAAAAAVLLLDHESTTGQIFNVSDDQPALLSECYQWLAQKVPGPHAIQSAESAAAPRKRGASNKRVSNAKLHALGWVPRYSSFAEGISKSVLPEGFCAPGPD